MKNLLALFSLFAATPPALGAQAPSASEAMSMAASVVSKIVKYNGTDIGEMQRRIVALADILGDWREEVITAVEGELRIYTRTIPATTRRVTLLKDRLYRIDTALESMGYFFGPQLGEKLFDAQPAAQSSIFRPN